MDTIKKLRDETGLSFAQIKKALDEAIKLRTNCFNINIPSTRMRKLIQSSEYIAEPCHDGKFWNILFSTV
mgnify:CR=1 FL=1